MSSNFHEVSFPLAIAFHSTGGPARRTEIVTLGSGYEERNAVWSGSRRHYDVGSGVRTLDDLAAVTAFFEARMGRLYGFRFRDFTDLPPLQSVTSVTLYAPDDAATVLDGGDYTVDPAGSRLLLKTLPQNLRAVNAVAVAFTAGYGAADAVPAPIAQAILQIISALYEHRGGDAAPTPETALALLAPYRILHL